MTEFRAKVFAAVKKIPKGETRTYKEIAQIIGHPRAFRAIGTVLSANYDPQIPCHRVIRSNGGMGGYNRGIPKKIAILRREGALTK